MERQIVGLMGVKGAGKDTCASYLVSHFGFTRLSFAEGVYQETAAAFGVPVELLGRRETKETPLAQLCLQRCSDPAFVRAALQSGVRNDDTSMHAPRSPRWVLQLWGTEYRRAMNENYWLDRVRARIADSPGQSFVITDVRFLNEARLVRSIGGKLVRVRRPQLELKEAAERAANGTAAHASETELADYPADLEVFNEEGAPESLLAQVARIIQDARQAA
jgi:hypothetical protein